MTASLSNSQRSCEIYIFDARHGSFNDYVPTRGPLGQSHTAVKPYSNLMQSSVIKLRVSPPLRDNGFMKSLPNLGMFLQSAMITRNHSCNLYFEKQRELLEMFNVAWSFSGINKSGAFNLWEAQHRSQTIARVSDRTYFLGVAYFFQARAYIDSCRLTIPRSYAGPFKINSNSATYLKHLPKIVSEVFMPEFFQFFSRKIPSQYSSLDGF